MATSTMSNTIKDGSGNALANIKVNVSLSVNSAFRLSDSSEIAQSVTAITDSNGLWSLELERTSNIDPENSFWIAEEFIPERYGGKRSLAFYVPDVDSLVYSNLVHELTSVDISDFDTYIQSLASLHRFNVLDYGAVGDDTVDDTVAIQAAIDALIDNGSGTLYSPPGYTYLISSLVTATLNDNIQVEFSGSTIHSTDDTGYIFDINGEVTAAVTTVASSVAVGATTLSVVSGSNISAGDLLLMKSSGENFNDDRPTTYIKGELVRVKTVVSNTLTLDYPTYDSYDTSGYTVTLDKFAPVTGYVKGLKLVGTGNQTDFQFGLAVRWFENFTVDESDFNAPVIGVALINGYNGHIKNSIARDCAYSGVGYGFQLNNVDNGSIKNCSGYKNRHTVDVGGGGASGVTAGKTRNYVIEGNAAYGDIASGISTHGACDNGDIINNTTVGCGGGYIVRGSNTRVKNNLVKRIHSNSGSYVHGIIVGDNGYSPPSQTWGNGNGGIGLILEDNYIDLTGSVYAGAIISVLVNDSLSNASIRNNRLVGHTGSGLVLQCNTVRNTFLEKNYIDNSSGGFSNYNILVIPTNPAGGAAVSGWNQKNLYITNNIIKGASNTVTAVRLVGNFDNADRSENVIVDNNTFLTGQTTGFAIIFAPSSTTYFGKFCTARNNLFPDSSLWTADGNSIAEGSTLERAVTKSGNLYE